MKSMIHYLHRVAAVGQPVGPIETFVRLVCLSSAVAGLVLMIFPSTRDVGVYAMLLGVFAFIAIAASWRGHNDPDG